MSEVCTMKKNLIWLACLGCLLLLISCSSTAGLTDSQKVGAKNSPSVLMSIYVSDKAEYLELDDAAYEKLNADKANLAAPVASLKIPASLIEASAVEVKTALESAGGFSFVDAAVIEKALAKSVEDVKKDSTKKGLKTLFNSNKETLAAGATILLADAALDAVGDELGFKDYTLVNPKGYHPVTPAVEDYSKAAVKAAKKAKNKAKSLVYVTVEFSVLEFKGEGVPYKPYCVTSVYITNKDGELVKTVKGAAFSEPVNYKDFIANPDAIIESYVDLMKESVQHTASNLDRKDGFFEIVKAELDTEKLLTDGNFAFHDSLEKNTSAFSEGVK